MLDLWPVNVLTTEKIRIMYTLQKDEKNKVSSYNLETICTNLNFSAIIKLKHFILFAASKSQIFRAPDMEPATTISSAFPNLTASTGLVCPAKLYKVGKAYRENLK